MSEGRDEFTENIAPVDPEQVVRNQQLVITLHGIRTFGGWQDRLEDLIGRVDTNHEIHVHPINYGYFSIFSFLLPFARYLAAWRIRKQMWRKIGTRQWSTIDIVAHSFGTYLVAHSVKWLQKKHPQLRIRTIILAGSVLPPRFDWNRLLLDGDRPCVGRVVNDCGTKDVILILSQLLVPFSSLSGRVGFQGVFGLNFRNRHFEFGHSGYFMTRGKPNDFMEKWWLPLLLEDKPIVRHDDRKVTSLSGPKTFLINHAELFKQGAIVLALYHFVFLPYQELVQSVEHFQVETSKQKLLRDGETHLARDYRLLAALELERRGYWNDAEPLLRNELEHVPRVYAALDLEPGERPASLSTNAKYLVTATERTNIRLREIETGHIVNSQKTERAPKAFAVRPNGTMIVAGFEGNFLWASTNEKIELEHRYPDTSVVHEVAFSDDSEYLAVRLETYAHIWNLSSGTDYIIPMQDHFTHLNFSRGGRYLAMLIQPDEIIYVHELGSGDAKSIRVNPDAVITDSNLELRFILVSNDGKYVAGVGSGMLHIWDMDTRRKTLEVHHGLNLTTSYTKELLSFDNTTKSFVMADEEGEVTRWFFRAPLHEAAMRHMKIQGKLFGINQTLDGKFLFVGQRGSGIVYWEETDWIGKYEELRCSSGGAFAATLYKDRQIRVWGRNGYPLIANLESDSVQDFAVSESHQALTILRQDGAVIVSSLADSNSSRMIEIDNHHNFKIFKSALSPNGDFAAFALGDRKIWLWDVHSSSVLGSLDARIGDGISINYYLEVSHLDVSCDGKSVRVQGMECDDDRNVCDDVDQEWQLGAEQLTGAFGWDDKCQAKIIGGVCDSVSSEQMLRAELVDQASQRITRNFTRAEWQNYFGDESYRRIYPHLP